MTASNKTTALKQMHIENGAKMVSFAGYSMPIQYPLGILKEHQHCRQKAGLFDVSHMGQAWVDGPNAAIELESLLPIDIVGLTNGQQRYGFFTNQAGGIDDDLMVSRWGDRYLVIVNAACKEADFKRLEMGLKTSQLTVITNRALIALQGPSAKNVLQRLGHDLSDLAFMGTRSLQIKYIECWISRSGYTGEDGFELSVNNDHAETLARLLQQDEATEWIGLGARDTLRLESGMCLYGHDIDSQTTPAEAALSWAISSVRRIGGEREGGFPGSDIILPQLGKSPRSPVNRKRVGFQPSGRAPIREGAQLRNKDGDIIGIITSGGFSPTLNQPIAMGYVQVGHHKKGSTVFTQIRKKTLELTVTSPTFVPNQFYRL